MIKLDTKTKIVVFYDLLLTLGVVTEVVAYTLMLAWLGLRGLSLVVIVYICMCVSTLLYHATTYAVRRRGQSRGRQFWPGRDYR